VIQQASNGNSPARLVTRDELCARLKLSKRTISRMIATRQLPAPLRLGHSVRWRESEIEEWIQRGCPAVESRRG
jgi:excisionase family DNA binding protein